MSKSGQPATKADQGGQRIAEPQPASTPGTDKKTEAKPASPAKPGAKKSGK